MHVSLQSLRKTTLKPLCFKPTLVVHNAMYLVSPEKCGYVWLHSIDNLNSEIFLFENLNQLEYKY